MEADGGTYAGQCSVSSRSRRCETDKPPFILCDNYDDGDDGGGGFGLEEGCRPRRSSCEHERK